jgi:hypothetical protein
MTRDAVLDAFSEGTVTRFYNVIAMADEIVVLRNDLVQMERLYRHHVEVSLDAIAKLNRANAILAKLREPSEAAMRAGNLHMLAMYRGEKKGNKYKLPLWGVISDILPAAVEAAEQEVSNARDSY